MDGDEIGRLKNEFINDVDVIQFRGFLLRIKHDEQYQNFGGMVKVKLPKSLYRFFNIPTKKIKRG
jgi:hypothetical protein